MKFSSLIFMFCNTVLVCIYAQASLGNGEFVQPYDNKIHKLLMRGFIFPTLMKENSVSDTPMKEADIYKVSHDSNRHGRKQYSPFFSYRPNFLPISYYGKRDGDMLQMIRSKYYMKNSENDNIEYEKRSVSSAVVRGDSSEYETLLRALNLLQSGKDSDLLNMINKYDDGFQQVLELLLPPLSADKLENIRSLLNSMIKRRFGSWGGRKRSEFYSWGGRKKRDQHNDAPQAEENRLVYLNEMKETEKSSGSNKGIEPSIYEDDGISALPTSNKRNNDFYPWGGKRTLPPSFSQY